MLQNLADTRIEKQLTDLLPGSTAHGNPSEPANPSHLRAAAAGDEDATTARTTPSVIEGSSEATKEA